MEIINVNDFEQAAKLKLNKSIYDFIAGGSGDEYTLNRNVSEFKRLQITPRILQSPNVTDTCVELLNHKLSNPFIVGPSAFHSCVHELGEIATAQAANSRGVGMVVSTMSSVSLEDISRVANCPLWFQLYLFKDRALTQQLIKRVEAAGFTAIVLTIDVPVMGTRERDQRNHFKWQHHLLSDQPLSSNHFSEAESNVKKRTDDLFDSNLSWSDIDWIKSQTDLPIILKGIMHEQDAIIALDFNVSALIISNHGGRQLDFMPSTIEVLPAIAAVVQQKIPIMIDGGFRRGVDIFKALALGADCILLGRSVLWALAVNGTAGIIDLFDIFSRELKEVMILCGCKTIEDIKTQGKECVRLKL